MTDLSAFSAEEIAVAAEVAEILQRPPIGSRGYEMYSGSGEPRLTAPRGAMYLRSDGDRPALYLNTDGAARWVRAPS